MLAGYRLALDELLKPVCGLTPCRPSVGAVLSQFGGHQSPKADRYLKRWQPCRSEFDKSNWLPLKSEQGVAYYLDLDAIRTKDGLRARIVADGAGVPTVMRNFIFTLDCRGRFRSEVKAEQYRVWESVKPGSAIAIAEGPVCYSGK